MAERIECIRLGRVYGLVKGRDSKEFSERQERRAQAIVILLSLSLSSSSASVSRDTAGGLLYGSGWTRWDQQGFDCGCDNSQCHREKLTSDDNVMRVCRALASCHAADIVTSTTH